MNCPGGPATGDPDPVGLVTVDVGVVEARCTDNGASASAAGVTIGDPLFGGIQLGALQSQCTSGPNGTASSSVLVLNGGGVLTAGVITAPTTVELLGLRIVLNEVINDGTTRTANALHITGGGLDIIVAQSQCPTTVYPLRVGVSGSPGAPAVFQLERGAPEVFRRPVLLAAGAVLSFLLMLQVFVLDGISSRGRRAR